MKNTAIAPDPVRVLDRIGKKRLIVGITNEHSLAWSAAINCYAANADLALTNLSEKARPLVEPFAKLAELLMARGGSLTTMSFLGAEKVVDHYNLMGPVQAALETSVRFLAHELWGGTFPLLDSDHTTAITGEILHVDAGFHVEDMVFH